MLYLTLSFSCNTMADLTALVRPLMAPNDVPLQSELDAAVGNSESASFMCMMLCSAAACSKTQQVVRICCTWLDKEGKLSEDILYRSGTSD